MVKGRFFFIEPSKVGPQHITLVQGYLQGILENADLREKFNLYLCISKETDKNLPENIKRKYKVNYIPVMNPEKRRLFRKSILEFLVVIYYIFRLKANDVLFITCMLPTSLFLLEIFFRPFKKKRVFVVLHGEIEGIFEKKIESPFRIGYWALKWYKIRRKNSALSLVVLDDFIKDKLIAESKGLFKDNNISVVHHPIVPFYGHDSKKTDRHSICFVGYKTRYKGFDKFCSLAKKYKSLDFRVVGGGQVENLTLNTTTPLDVNNSYLKNISESTISLFPYSYRYDCSLSAAAIDALATGTYIIATDRPFFVNLATYFGEKFITVYHDDKELNDIMQKLNPDHIEKNRSERMAILEKSKYCIKEVGNAICRMALTN